MTYRVVEVKRDRPRLNAAALAKRQAEALIEFLAESIRGGFSPVDGSDRPRKANQKPLGFDTGRLARGLRARSAGSTREKAAYRIDPPADRMILLELTDDGGESFIDRHDLITTQGRAAEVIEEATVAYFAELRAR